MNPVPVLHRYTHLSAIELSLRKYYYGYKLTVGLCGARVATFMHYPGEWRCVFVFL